MNEGGVSPPSSREAGPSTRHSSALRAGRIAVAVGLTAFIVWRADPSQVFGAAASADWTWLAAAVALVLLDRVLMAYRWMVLLSALSPGTRPPFADIIRIFFISTFVGSFLPSIAGDAYRAFSLARLNVRGAEAAASVIMDRALGVLSMVVVAIAALALARERIAVAGVLPTALIAAAACAVAAAGLYSERVASLAYGTARLLPGERAQRVGARLLDAVRRYATHHGAVSAVLAASLGVQVVRVVQAYFLGVAIGISLPLSSYFVFIPLIVLVMQLPITVMGLGTSQVMFELFFGQAGVSSPHAVALSILFVALGVVGNLPGAVFYLGNSKSRKAAPAQESASHRRG